MSVQKGKQKLLCALKDAKKCLEKTNIDSFKSKAARVSGFVSDKERLASALQGRIQEAIHLAWHVDPKQKRGGSSRCWGPDDALDVEGNVV